MDINELDNLSGEDFEKALNHLLEKQGFSSITYTPKSKDFGIDILAEKEGKKVGIQVKRSINTIQISAVQQVLGGIVYYDCNEGMIITNSFLTDSAIKLASKGNVKIITRKDLKKWLEEFKISIEPIEIHPRQYQKEALLNLEILRKNNKNKSLIIMASGLGKTYVSAFDVLNFEQYIGKSIKTLYLAHQAVILEQASRSFRKVFGDKRMYGRFDGEEKQKDKDFTFATFQSMSINLGIFDSTQFDYIIIDEAHHSAAETRDRVINYFKPRFLLGLTATPNRLDGRDISSYYDDNIALNLPLERALSENLLTPIEYKVYSDQIVASKLKLYLENIDTIGEEGEDLFKPRTDREIVSIINKLQKQNFKTERTIIFCSSLSQMDHFAKLFKNSVTISGREHRKEQIKRIDMFSGGHHPVLLARDVLNEGIDIPSANMIVFLRNTESPTVFLQQLGRGLRITDDKKKVVVLDFVCNIERIKFLYSFYSKLRYFLRTNRDTNGERNELLINNIQFDETAKDIIEALLQKKIKSGFILPLEKLLASFNYKINISTLKKFIKNGLLVPDYEIFVNENNVQFYFDLNTVKIFMRKIRSIKETENFMDERKFAKKLGKGIIWLRQQEKWGKLLPSWLYINSLDRMTFFYSEKDLLNTN